MRVKVLTEFIVLKQLFKLSFHQKESGEKNEIQSLFMRADLTAVTVGVIFKNLLDSILRNRKGCRDRK